MSKLSFTMGKGWTRNWKTTTNNNDKVYPSKSLPVVTPSNHDNHFFRSSALLLSSSFS